SLSNFKDSKNLKTLNLESTPIGDAPVDAIRKGGDVLHSNSVEPNSSRSPKSPDMLACPGLPSVESLDHMHRFAKQSVDLDLLAASSQRRTERHPVSSDGVCFRLVTATEDRRRRATRECKLQHVHGE